MLKRLVLKAIKLWELTRVFRAPCCRYYPSCSEYAYVAIERHGLIKGSLMGAWRLLRCYPMCPGGIDFVPEKP